MNSLSGTIDYIAYKVDRVTTTFAVVLILFVIAYATIKYRKSIRKLFPRDIKLCLRGHEHGIIFGTKGPLTCFSPESEEGHVIDYAGSGLGKTRTQVLQTLNSWNGTVLCIDLAGDIISNTPEIRRYVYQPWLEISIPYNVFYNVDFAEGKDNKLREINEVIDALMPKKIFDSETDEYYYKMAIKILKASFYTFYFQGLEFVGICREIRKSTWRDLFKKIHVGRMEEAVVLIKDVEDEKETNIGSGKARANEAIALFADEKVLETTLRRPKGHEFYFSPHTLEHDSLYIDITEKYNMVYGTLMQLISNQCLKHIMQRENYSGNCILLCLDEYSSLGYVDLMAPLDKFRKKRCRLYIHVQSILQLDNMYSPLRREIMMENFKFQIIMGSNVPRIQKLFADIIGHKAFDRDAYKEDPEDMSNLGKYIYVKCPGGAMKIKKKFKLSKRKD